MSFLDPKTIIASFGLLGAAFIVFAESGLLVGFFLPGDTLLFSAGFFASQGLLNIWTLIPTLWLAAVLGDSVGYTIGKRSGHRLFNKKDSMLFNHEYIERSEEFYEKHGGKTIILARFVPIVRTFAPMLAGVGKMHYTKFLSFNIIGGGLWTILITLLGYKLGETIPNVDKYILPAILLATAFTFGQPIVHILKDPVTRKKLFEKLSSTFKLKNNSQN